MVFYNLSYYFWGQCCFWTETTLFCNNFCFFILLHCPQLFPPCPTTAPAICVGAGKNLWVRRIFSETFLYNFANEFSPTKIMKTFFGMTSKEKKVFMCFSANVGYPFWNQRTLGAIFAPILRDFAQILPGFSGFLPGFSTNENFWGCACTSCSPTSYTTGPWSLICLLSAIIFKQVFCSSLLFWKDESQFRRRCPEFKRWPVS